MRKKIITFLLAFFAIGALSGCQKTIDTYGHCVTWKNDDGTTLLVQHDVSDGSMAYYPLSNPTKNTSDADSYYFLGWSPKLSRVYSDQTYTAVYERNGAVTYYNIFYDLGDIKAVNSPFNPTSFYYGDYLTLYEPTREGYIFTGWIDYYDNLVETIDTTKAEDLYLYATWKKATYYNVMVYSNGLDSAYYFSENYTCTSGENFYYSAPCFDIYNFVEWRLNGIYYSSSPDISITILGNYQLEAVYTSVQNMFDVNIYSNYMDLYYNEYLRCTYNTYITRTATMYPGYSFVGWYVNGMCYTYSDTIGIYVSQDLDIVATYMPLESYNVRFYSNNPAIKVEDYLTYYFGDTIEYYAPTFSYALFTGFYLNGTLLTSDTHLTYSGVYQDMEIELGYTYISDDLSYYEFDSDAGGFICVSHGYSNSDVDVTIPDYIAGYPVFQVAANAFNNDLNLRDVTIGKNVETIGDYAFAYSSVEHVYFSSDSSLSSLGEYAFVACGNLTSIDLSPCFLLSTLRQYSFYDCTNLLDVYLPNMLTSIESCCFGYIDVSLSINIPDSVTYVDFYGFCNMPNATIIINNRYQEQNWNSNWHDNVGNIQYTFD